MRGAIRVIYSIIAGSLIGVGGYILSLDTKIIYTPDGCYSYYHNPQERIVFYHPNSFVTVELIGQGDDQEPYKKVISQIGPRINGQRTVIT